MIFGLRHFSLFVFFTVLAVATRADVVLMADQRQFPAAEVTGYSGEGGGSFQIRPMPGSNGFPVTQAQLTSIEFRTASDTSAQPQGRPANIVLTNQQRMDGVTLERLVSTQGDPRIFARLPGVAIGGPVFPVPLASIASIEFPSASPVAPPPPTPTPAAAAAPQLPTAGATSSVPVPPARGGWDSDEEGEMDWTERSTVGALAGWTARLVALGTWLFAATLSNFLYLKFAAWFFRIPDVSWKKAFYSGAALGTLPTLVFQYLNWLLPIPVIGFWVAIAGAGWLARAIIEGGLEIQETQAWIVSLLGFAISFGVLFFSISWAASLGF